MIAVLLILTACWVAAPTLEARAFGQPILSARIPNHTFAFACPGIEVN